MATSREAGEVRVRRTLPMALAATLVLGACFEFVEPEIPTAGRPATLQLNLSIVDGHTAVISARLTPGYDRIGIRRALADDPSLRVLDRDLQPSAAGPDTVRLYNDTLSIEPTRALGPLTAVPPSVPGTTAPAPMVWYGIRRVGPDTLTVATGGDLTLELEVVEGGTAAIRQWFVALGGSSGTVRLSADGPPPERVFIPWHWLPDPFAEGSIAVTLTDVQNETRAGPADDYVVAGSVQSRVSWTVRVDDE